MGKMRIFGRRGPVPQRIGRARDMPGTGRNGIYRQDGPARICVIGRCCHERGPFRRAVSGRDTTLARNLRRRLIQINLFLRCILSALAERHHCVTRTTQGLRHAFAHPRLRAIP